MAALIAATAGAAAEPKPATAPRPAAPPAGSAEASQPSATPIGLTLADAVALAVRDNRAIRSVYLARVAQRFDLRVAEAKFTPILNLNASYDVVRGQVPGNSTAPVRTAAWAPTVTLLAPTGAQFGFAAAAQSVRGGGNPNVDSTGYSATLIQPLLKGFGFDVNRASIVQARLQERANVLSLYGTVIDQVTQVVFAYRSLVQAREQVGIARESLNSARSLLAVNRELVAAGRMAANDVLQTEANVATQELSLVQAENALTAARYTLLQLLALDTSSQIDAVDQIDAKQVPIDLDRSQDLALRWRPDWRQSQLGLEISRLNLLLAEDGQRWTLNLRAGTQALTTGSGLQRAARAASDTVPGWNVGLVLNIPIGDLSLEQRVVGAKTDLARADLALVDLRQTIDIAVRNAVRNVDVAWRTLLLARQARDLSVKKLAVEREKLAAGRSSNFQVVTYEVDTVNAKNQELAAVIGYLNALTALDQSLGTTLLTWDIDIGERVDGDAR